MCQGQRQGWRARSDPCGSVGMGGGAPGQSEAAGDITAGRPPSWAASRCCRALFSLPGPGRPRDLTCSLPGPTTAFGSFWCKACGLLPLPGAPSSSSAATWSPGPLPACGPHLLGVASWPGTVSCSGRKLPAVATAPTFQRLAGSQCPLNADPTAALPGG